MYIYSLLHWDPLYTWKAYLVYGPHEWIFVIKRYPYVYTFAWLLQNFIILILALFLSVGTNLSTPLNLLTESRVPTISKVIEKAKGQHQVYATKGPIADSQLMPILYFLFPDAEDEPVITNNSMILVRIVIKFTCQGLMILNFPVLWNSWAYFNFEVIIHTVK